MRQTNETNTQVLAHLQELAQLYFTEIIRINHLMPGNYSARNIMTENYKEPDDKKFDEDITIECGAFKMKINYRKIFVALARWETTMQVPSKQRATFAVGSVEEKNIKVLTVETDIYSETLEKKTVEKRMRLQRICGNWWVPKKNLKNDLIDLYYNLNGVFFRPCNISSHEITPENRATLIAKLEEYDKILIDRLLSENVQSQPYFVEVCRRAQIGNNTQPKTAQIGGRRSNVTTEGKATESPQNAIRDVPNSSTKVEIMTEDEYLARKNAEYFGEPATHKGRQKTLRAQRRLERFLRERNRVIMSHRERLRAEYREKVKQGEVRPPTVTEQLIRAARGHPDTASAHAAQRACTKRGINW